MNTVDIIRKKRDGGILTREEIEHWISGTVSESIPEYQTSALLMATCIRGMTDEEAAILTDVMAHSGSMFTPEDLGGFSVDKHSTGGVGDTTTLVTASAVGAFVDPNVGQNKTVNVTSLGLSGLAEPVCT